MMSIDITTNHKIIFGDSRKMDKIDDESVHLVVTFPPYPMIEMWDNLFKMLNPKISELWTNMENEENEEKKEKLICKYII